MRRKDVIRLCAYAGRARSNVARYVAMRLCADVRAAPMLSAMRASFDGETCRAASRKSEYGDVFFAYAIRCAVADSAYAQYLVLSMPMADATVR